MKSQETRTVSPRWNRMAAILGPFGVPLLIELECNLQSMILFEGFFVALFLLPAALTLRRFLKAELSWPADRVEAWTRASVVGTIAAVIATFFYALSVRAPSVPERVAESSPGTAQYLTVAIAFPLVVGICQAFAIAPGIRWPALWPVVPPIGCAISYGASQVIEKLESVDPSGLVTLVLTLVVAFLITYWIQRVALRLLRPKPG